MTLSEAVKTIKNYCSKRRCGNCVFTEDGEYVCGLERDPEEWIDPPETNLYDEEEIHDNCTVQILKNSITGETSIGWWRMEIDMLSIIKDLEETMDKALIDKFLADEDIQLLIECLHDNGMSYKNILKAFMEYDDKKKKEKEK